MGHVRDTSWTCPGRGTIAVHGTTGDDATGECCFASKKETNCDRTLSAGHAAASRALMQACQREEPPHAAMEPRLATVAGGRASAAAVSTGEKARNASMSARLQLSLRLVACAWRCGRVSTAKAVSPSRLAQSEGTCCVCGRSKRHSRALSVETRLQRRRIADELCRGIRGVITADVRRGARRGCRLAHRGAPASSWKLAPHEKLLAKLSAE